MNEPYLQVRNLSLFPHSTTTTNCPPFYSPLQTTFLPPPLPLSLSTCPTPLTIPSFPLPFFPTPSHYLFTTILPSSDLLYSILHYFTLFSCTLYRTNTQSILHCFTLLHFTLFNSSHLCTTHSQSILQGIQDQEVESLFDLRIPLSPGQKTKNTNYGK